MVTYDNTPVRRQDRLLPEAQAFELLAQSEYAVLAMVEERDGAPAGYGIPINYVWDGAHSIYFHCAPMGHKLENLDVHPQVTLTLVGRTHVIAQKFTTNYQSVIVRGRITRHLPEEERMHALELILDKYSPLDKEVGMKYAAKSFHRTEILRMDITSMTGKEKHVAL